VSFAPGGPTAVPASTGFSALTTVPLYDPLPPLSPARTPPVSVATVARTTLRLSSEESPDSSRPAGGPAVPRRFSRTCSAPVGRSGTEEFPGGDRPPSVPTAESAASARADAVEAPWPSTPGRGKRLATVFGPGSVPTERPPRTGRTPG
jgi:hypothetical protein